MKTDIKLKVVPRSSRDQIIGREGEIFKVKLTAPPLEGMANKALIKLLSKRLRISKKSIEIIAGEKSRLKSIRIHGLSMEEVTAFLEQ